MAVDLKELWIGDHLRSLSSHVSGRFAGEEAPGVARVSVKGEIRLFEAEDLELIGDPDEDPPDDTLVDEPTRPVHEMVHFERSIDLHIEQLNPSLQNASSATILRYQLQRCRSFLDQATGYRADWVRIIHGVGKGVLQGEVERILQEHPAVVHYLPGSGGGAFDVQLRI